MLKIVPRAGAKYLEKSDLKSLNLNEITEEQVYGILQGTINPEGYKSVHEWIEKCYNKPRTDELKMCAINELIAGYGVESVTTEDWQNGYWCNILCDYVNMGDTYIPTVINHREKGFIICSWGDLMELEESENNKF
jgi:hypothetical protein